MALLINIPDADEQQFWRIIEEGQKAFGPKAILDNPYPYGLPEYDFWLLGYLAAKYQWDIEI